MMQAKREIKTMKIKNLIGYIRVSTNQQAESGLGLADQEAKIKSYCQTYDINLIDIIVDDGISAKDLNRAGIQAAIERTREDNVDGIIIAKLDRLTRSIMDLQDLLHTVFNTAELHCVNDKIDTSTASGRLCLNVICSVIQWEREAISERTSSALQAKKRLNNNNSINGTAPYGKEWIDGELVDCKDEQNAIQMLIKFRRAGNTHSHIAKLMNINGISNRSGQGWTESRVRLVLKANHTEPKTAHVNTIVSKEVASAKASETIKAKKRQSGKNANGRAPYGYQWINGELSDSPTERIVLETMKQLRDLGQTFQQIANRLEAMGHVTRKGGEWRTSSVHAILKKAS